MSEFAQASTARFVGGRAWDLTGTTLWFLSVIYAAARFLQIFPGKVPMVGVVAFHVLPPLAFALIHGGRAYRVRGVVTFVVLFLAIGNLFENLSVATGFPFGHYYFTDLMGPKLFQVPVFLGLAYIGMAYVSWCLSNIILRTADDGILGAKVVLTPLLAALIMTSWDVSQDPVWSTYLHLWIWPRGGPYFGVPISNFLGWFLTVYVIYQSFALYACRHAVRELQGKNSGALAIVFYAVCAAGNLLPLFRAGKAVVADPSGTLWKVRDITMAAAFVSVFIMGSFVMWTWLQLARSNVEEQRFSA